MWQIENNFRVIVGSNIFIKTPNILCYNKNPIFTLERRESDGILGISFEIYDEHGQKVAVVRENRIYSGKEEDYEIYRGKDRYTLMEKATGRTICEIIKMAFPSYVELLVSARLYMPDGFLLELSPQETNLPGLVIRRSRFVNAAIGIDIGEKGSFLGLGVSRAKSNA